MVFLISRKRMKGIGEGQGLDRLRLSDFPAGTNEQSALIKS